MQPTPDTPPSTRLRDGLTAAALAAVTFAAFYPALGCDFINFDDPEYVTKNPIVARGLSAAGTQWAFTSVSAFYWHPLTWLSLQMDASLSHRPDGSLDPRGFHRTNVLLHAGSAALLFLALRSLTGAYWRSLATVALFALHPLRVESVAWVAERKDVLSVFFGFAALWAYARYAAAPSAVRYLAVALALALSLMSKPMLVTLPFLFLVLDWWPLARWPGRGVRQLLLEKIPLLALVVACGVVAFIGQVGHGAVGGLGVFTLPQRVANAIVSYVIYLRMAVWPAKLAVFYPHPAYFWGGGLPAWEVAGAALLLVAVTAAAVVLRGRAPYFLAGWLWYLGTLLPVIGLAQAGAQARADRFTYFPQVGIAVAVCWGVAALAGSRWRVALAAAAVVLLALVVQTERQLSTWRNSLTLWAHALKNAPESPESLIHYGDALSREPGERRREEAVASYSRALDLDGTSAAAHNGLGILYLRAGQWEKAQEQFEAACRLPPTLPESHTNLGVVLSQLGKFDEAAREHQRAIEMAPELVDAYGNLGQVEIARGAYARAADCYRNVLRLRPGDARAMTNLGMVLFREKKFDEALPVLREAVQRDPRSAPAHVFLGLVLQEQGDSREAGEHLNQASRLDPGLVQRLGGMNRRDGSPSGPRDAKP
jgi:tetratricopeptide (TPR) repeat protein